MREVFIRVTHCHRKFVKELIRMWSWLWQHRGTWHKCQGSKGSGWKCWRVISFPRCNHLQYLCRGTFIWKYIMHFVMDECSSRFSFKQAKEAQADFRWKHMESRKSFPPTLPPLQWPLPAVVQRVLRFFRGIFPGLCWLLVFVSLFRPSS